jgi:hypothetical protein
MRGEKHDDSAQRFICLIGMLYDHDVTLLISVGVTHTTGTCQNRESIDGNIESGRSNHDGSTDLTSYQGDRMMFRWAWVVLILGLPVQAEESVIPDPDWKVARAKFTTAVRDREPVDEVVLLASPANQVFFFTDLRHLQGRKVSHRWKYQGGLVLVKTFEVGGPRWRVYSRVDIEPDQLGEWSVTVTDESGWPLHIELFRYVRG